MPEKDKSDHPYTIIRGWGPPKEPPAQPPKESSFQQPKKSQETVFASAQPTEEPKQEKARVIPILLLLLGVLAAAVMVFFLFIFKPQVQTQVTSSVPTAAMDTLGKTDNVALTQKIIQTVKENSPVYFIPDQEYWLPGEEKKLDLILKAFTGLKKVNLTVTGHTADDNKPVPQSILSEERALIVKNYLMQKSIGFDLSITTVGKGATELVVKDMPIDQQEPNRRVEILLDSIEQEQ